MIDVTVIHNKTFSPVPLSSIQDVSEISPCVANIRALSECIMNLAAEQQLWLEPNEEMIQAGLAEVQQFMDEAHQDMDFDAREMSDNKASDLAIFVLQAMAGKRNG